MNPRPHDPGPSPARWLAAGLIGGASIVGMLWTLLGRAPAGPLPVLPAAVEAPPARPAPTPAPLAAPGLIQPGPGPIPEPKSAPRTEPGTDPDPAALEAASSPTAPAAVLPGAADSRPSPAVPATPAVRLNINTATLAELELLPRVGPTLAGRIIEHRETNGPIRSLTDLMKVKGIGARTAEALAPYIRFE